MPRGGVSGSAGRISIGRGPDGDACQGLRPAGVVDTTVYSAVRSIFRGSAGRVLPLVLNNPLNTPTASTVLWIGPPRKLR